LLGTLSVSSLHCCYPCTHAVPRHFLGAPGAAAREKLLETLILALPQALSKKEDTSFWSTEKF